MKLLIFCLKQWDDLLLLWVLWVQLHVTEVTIKRMKRGQLACILFKHVDYIYFPLVVFPDILLPLVTGSGYANAWLLNRFFSCLKNNVLILCRILSFNFTLLASPVNKLPWMLIFPLAFQSLTKVLCHSPAGGSSQPRCSNAVGSHTGSSMLPQSPPLWRCPPVWYKGDTRVGKWW